MKRLAVCLALIIGLSVAYSAAFGAWGGFCCYSTSNLGWATLPIGPGGYVTSFDIQCDAGIGACNGSGTATLISRNDTYGAHYYNRATTNCGNANRTGCWQQLVTPNAMPNGTVGSGGTYEIAIAPSNTSHWYMFYGDGNIYSTTNKGTTWTATGWSTLTVDPNNSCRFMGQFMAVDPHNENLLVVGTPNSGIYYTTDGGANFTHISTGTLPASSTGICSGGNGVVTGGNALIAFDPHSWSSGNTPGIYVSVYGTGVYHASTGVTGSWTLTSGTPTTHRHMVVDPQGDVWLTDNGGADTNVWVYNGSWTNKTNFTSGGGLWPIAVDTNNCASLGACHIATRAQSGCYMSYSADGGTTVVFSNNLAFAATDVPWLAGAENCPNVGNVVFDMTGSNSLDFSSGIGFFNTTPPTSGGAAWTLTSYSAAIEQLDNLDVIYSPGCSGPNVAFQDRPVFYSTSLTQYPSTYSFESLNKDNVSYGWGIDYAAQNSTTIVVNSSSTPNSHLNLSGYSSDCGATWTQFSTLPTDMYPTGSTSGPLAFFGGNIAASTSSNFVVVFSQKGSLNYTLDGGSTWQSVVPTNVAGAATGITNAGTATNSNVLHFDSTAFAHAYSILHANDLGSIPYRAYDLTASSGYYDVVSASSNSVTLSTNVSPAVSSGDAIFFQPTSGSGWGDSAFNKQHTICADRVTANLFYAYNWGADPGHLSLGIWRSADGGATWALAYSGSLTNANDTWMECVPGQGGHILVTGAINGQTDATFYECTDSAGTITCSAISSVINVSAFGFGRTKTGSGYPCIYFYGKYSGTQGYWQSCDHFGSAPTQVGQQYQNTFDPPISITGNPNLYGLFYVCFNGSGCQYNRVN